MTFNATYSYKSHLSCAHSHQLDKALGLGRALDVWDQASCRPNTSAPESCHCPVGQVELLMWVPREEWEGRRQILPPVFRSKQSKSTPDSRGSKTARFFFFSLMAHTYLSRTHFSPLRLGLDNEFLRAWTVPWFLISNRRLRLPKVEMLRCWDHLCWCAANK